jgi:uncharacterized protein YjgD (DUF1641 family)
MSKNGNPALWDETPAGQQVKARLAEEKTLLALDKILARLNTVEEAISGLATVMHQGPGMVAMVADMADEVYRQADNRGVSIEQHLGTALELAEKLTDPAMVDKLNGILAFTDQLPGLIAMGMDTLDESLRQARENGLEPETMMEWAAQFGRAMRETQAEPPTKVGVFGMLTALRDPDRQKALGFSLNFLKHLGKQL